MTDPLMRGADDEPFHHSHGFQKPKIRMDQGVKSIGCGNDVLRHIYRRKYLQSGFCAVDLAQFHSDLAGKIIAQCASSFAGNL